MNHLEWFPMGKVKQAVVADRDRAGMHEWRRNVLASLVSKHISASFVMCYHLITQFVGNASEKTLSASADMIQNVRQKS
jgi:hypothetical protein